MIDVKPIEIVEELQSFLGCILNGIRNFGMEKSALRQKRISRNEADRNQANAPKHVMRQ